uniref:zinc finger protein 180-like n=1 Tax=Epinephelus lanceolatus TaxID=310571 RepID=UPI001446DF79|nr:zinc finger protein 180-like [Epinephelus lanceolatus]
MSSVEYLREFVNERLTAAAEEIFGVFKRTIVEYEDVIDRQRKLLDVVWKPDIELIRIELPQQHVCKEMEEEGLAEQQLRIQEMNSSVDQEEPEPPLIKEEEEEVCSSQEGEQLVLKQETDGFMLIPPYEESDHSEPETNSDHQLLSYSSHVTESQDQVGGEQEDSGSTRNTELQPNKRHHESSIHRSNDNNCTMSKIHSTTHRGRNYFKCDTCERVFKFRSQLYAHMRQHTGEKPFLCKTCGKAFRRNGDLKVHVRIHTGEKPYVCRTCGKRFCEMSALTRHMKTHTGEKPHTCKTCGKAFRRRDDLRVHLRTHSDERPYTCETCRRDFRSSSNLKSHMRKRVCEKLSVQHRGSSCGHTHPGEKVCHWK